MFYQDMLPSEMKNEPRNSPVLVTMPPFGISAFTSRHASDFRMPTMSHGFGKLCWVESGRGEFIFHDQRVPIGKGTLLVVPGELQHRFVDAHDAPLTLTILCVELVTLERQSAFVDAWKRLNELLTLGEILEIPNSYWDAEIQRLFRAIMLELGQTREGREAMVIAFSMQLIILVSRIATDRYSVSKHNQLSPAFLASVTELEDRFADTLQISDLARRAGMCYRSYTENFRRYKGMTVTQYITQRRVEFSQRRMVETGDIMGSALEAGFGDLSHFYRTFKRHVGHTPLEFIRNHQNEKS
jgi:AraC-like DNA-binding protein/mannose-6-phosphate isomerase-like protein (cupin superfamily)